jgi:NAD(P)-dependent dehydrogenase (short-subunit alcohol dehydrogenase family)
MSIEINLAGKTALITGSTSGMGHAAARALATAGARVVLNGRTESSVTTACQNLRQVLPQAEVRGIAADVGEPEAIDRLIEMEPRVDVLVTSAGPTESKPFFEISDDDWERFFRVYVMSAVRLSRYYAERMIERGWGRLIFNAHVFSGYMTGEMVHWGVSKAALLGLSRGLAENLAGTGVTANAFVPGPTHTEESFMRHAKPTGGKSFTQIEKELFEGPLQHSIVKRFIDPSEVASVIVFLASGQASAITGAVLRVDGGSIRFPL